MNKELKTSAKAPNQNKRIGLFWLLGPIVAIISVLLIYALLNAVFAGSGFASVLRYVNLVLGLIGLIAVIALPVGLIVGIVYLSKRVPVVGAKMDVRSGKGAESVVPGEIKGWNWGAAGLTWIWGLSNKVWISILSFVPVLNVIMIFVLGAKGNEWAWRNKQWESVEVFKEYQNKWKPWGVFFFILSVLGIASTISRLA